MTLDATSTRSFPVMGTTAHVLLHGRTIDGLLDHAEARINRLERLWSRFLPDSEVCRLNLAGGIPLVVSPETFTLISQAVDAWTLTGGAFDPTIGGSMKACGYDQAFSAIDLDEAIGPDRYRAAPGPAHVVLHPYTNAVELGADTNLDLGGIAKGAAADLIAAELVDAGADGCIVNIGGDLATAGAAPRSEGWQITLDCPGAPITIDVGIERGAVCTSTVTRRRWGGPDRTEHHLRHPETGAPLDTGIASVTIIAERAVQAEVLTKAVMTAGERQGIALAESAGATGLVVRASGEVTTMIGLDRFRAAALTSEPA